MFLLDLYRQCQHYKLNLFIVIMSVPVSNFTVEEAHKEFKSTELVVLLACMSQLCQRLNLPMPAQFHRPLFFKHRRALFRLKSQAGSLG